MKLPALEAIMDSVKNETSQVDRFVFVSVQHLLNTTIDVFEALIDLGAVPRSIFLLGKHYSTSPDVYHKAIRLGMQVQPLAPLQRLGEYKEVMNKSIENMWEKVRFYLKTHPNIDNIIILDDGGRCLRLVPEDIVQTYRVVGIEQTSRGIVKVDGYCNFPYIDISTSASKTLEADMVANAIIDKLSNKLPSSIYSSSGKPITCGIVGLGFIGHAVAKKLSSLGYSLCLFDANHLLNKAFKPNDPIKNKVVSIRKALPSFLKAKSSTSDNSNSVEYVGTVEELIEKSDYIFGCTGTDFTHNLDFVPLLKGHKRFISCASEDTEFLSILKYIQNQEDKKFNPLEDIHWSKNENDSVCIVSGGFPCNFDHSGTSVPANDIQLTRALILGALIQAIIIYPSYRRNAIKGRIMLDPSMQKFIVAAWYTLTQKKERLTWKQRNNFSDIFWIIQNSGGLFHKVPQFSNIFNVTREIDKKEGEDQVSFNATKDAPAYMLSL